MNKIPKLTLAVIAIALAFLLAGCVGLQQGSSSAGSSVSSSSSSSSYTAQHSSSGSAYAESGSSGTVASTKGVTVTKNGEYTDKDHVALYIHQYGHVPSNYITKTKARAAGWVNTEGNLWDVLPGKSIGGGGYSNDDGALPDARGRQWYECDIDYEGGFRNSKRIVYSNDGLIYYTDDHYKTFERLY